MSNRSQQDEKLEELEEDRLEDMISEGQSSESNLPSVSCHSRKSNLRKWKQPAVLGGSKSHEVRIDAPPLKKIISKSHESIIPVELSSRSFTSVRERS